MDNITTYYPLRSPLAIVDAIKDIIEDKVVCDIGCGEGDILWLMSRYAKKVIGLDNDPKRFNHAIRKGIEVVQGNLVTEPFPIADVYYCWPDLPSYHIPIVISKIKDATLIIGGRKEVDHLLDCLNKHGGFYREFHFSEPFQKDYPDFNYEGFWWAYILKL